MMKILLWACAEFRRALGKNRAGEKVRMLESVKGLKWLYYASNSLRGACFAKALQPEGAEDMSKGPRGGWESKKVRMWFWSKRGDLCGLGVSKRLRERLEKVSRAGKDVRWQKQHIRNPTFS